MAKIVLDTVTGGYDLSVINNNFDKIETEFQNKVLYRDNPVGEVNTLQTDIDANSKRLYNLPAPTLASEAARLQDIQGLMNGLGSLVQFTPYKNISSINLQSAIQEEIDDLESSTGSSLIGTTQTGTGAVSRTSAAKLNDFVSTSDFTTLAQAKTAAVNKPVYDPVGIVHKDAFNNLANTFQETGETTWKAAHILRSSDNTGAHSGQAYSNFQVEYRPIGSSANGPTNADYGASFSVIKQNFATTTTQGEIDGLNIVVRQGGVVNSDCAGILCNVQNTKNSGFIASWEAQTSQIDDAAGGFALLRQIQTQLGTYDPVANLSIGIFAEARTGALNEGIRIAEAVGSSWASAFKFVNNAGLTTINISRAGNITLTASSGSAPGKTIRVLNDALSVLNNAQTQEILNLSDTGILTVGQQLFATNLIANQAAATGGAGTISYGSTTSATANTGASGAPPAQVAGYIIVNIAGTQRKIPFYAD